MFANGMFYGIDQSTVAQDILASFMISLVGTAPQLIIRLLFKNAKPRVTTSAKSPKASITLTFRSSKEVSSSKSCQLDEKKSKPPASELVKIEDAAQMREEMYNGMYPLPSYVREFAWVLLLLVSAVACCAAVCCLFIAFHERLALKSCCPYV